MKNNNHLKDAIIAQPNTEVVVEPTQSNQEKENHEVLCRMIASRFVRRDNRFFDVNATGNSLTNEDLKRVCLKLFEEQHADIELTNDLVGSVFKTAISDRHTDAQLGIQVWNNTEVCNPGDLNRLVNLNGQVAINRWVQPNYRTLGITEADWGPFQEFITRVIAYGPDRRLLVDWLSWGLQNEQDKLGWAVLLYSRRKGTGKSVIAQIASALYGRDNSMIQNGVGKLTGRFNLPVLMRKFVALEEIQLRPGSTQGNTLKTYLTERDTTAEAKGKELQTVVQSCNFMLTTNHLPTWIEPGDRRYAVIDLDHDGYALGPKAEEFKPLVREVIELLRDERAIAKLYNALMAWRQSNSFDPKSLNQSQLQSPIMQTLANSSQHVVVDQVEELLHRSGLNAIGQRELISLCSGEISLNNNQLRHIMPELGWRAENAKWGGVDFSRKIYVRQGYNLDRGHVVGPNGDRQAIGQQVRAAKPEEESVWLATDGDEMELIY